MSEAERAAAADEHPGVAADEAALLRLGSAHALDAAITAWDARATIPRVFHQSWKSCEVPRKQHAWQAHCGRVLLPEWRMQLFTDAANRELIATHFPSFLPLYDGYDTTIKRVDAARLFYIFRYGGVYADMDMLCLRPLEQLPLRPGHVTLGFDRDSVLLGRNCSDGGCFAPGAMLDAKGHDRGAQLEESVPNAFFAAPKGHPFIAFLIHRLAASAHMSFHHNPSPIASTGPVFLARAIRAWLKRPAVRQRQQTLLAIRPMPLVYSRRSGNNHRHPCGWQVSEVRNDRGDLAEGAVQSRAFAKCTAAMPGSVLTTFWTASWAQGWGLELLAMKVAAADASERASELPAKHHGASHRRSTLGTSKAQARSTRRLSTTPTRHAPHAQVPLRASLARCTSEQHRDLLLRLHSGELPLAELADAAAAMAASRRDAGRRLSSAEGDAPLHAVPLFRKPAASTGQLVAVREGLDVLRAQTAPFAIVSAVGPTRTGKSTILGRTFLRGGAHENAFEIGAGVTSFTGGVWIASRPIVLRGADGHPLNVLLVDTEGFAGVGGLTSRTYEANLFGLVYLMSSAVLYNTMFPVDASTARLMSGHCSHALRVLKELHDHRVWSAHRRPPRLVWAVQGFNLYNLRNTGISADELLGALSNATRGDAGGGGARGGGLGGPAAAAMLGTPASASTEWLVARLFSHVRLVPIRRPHASDEVVANLASVPSARLSPEYLADTDSLRAAFEAGLEPVHRCTHAARPERHGAALPRLRARRCDVEPWTGAGFADELERWLQHGHIVDEGDAPDSRAANASAELAAFTEESAAWLRKQCRGARRDLKRDLKPLWRNVTRHARARARALRTAQGALASLPRASLSRAVQQGVFWRQPGAVAALMEQHASRERLRCAEELSAHARDYEAGLVRWWSWLRAKEERRREERRRVAGTPPPPPPPREPPPASWLRVLFASRDARPRQKDAHREDGGVTERAARGESGGADVVASRRAVAPSAPAQPRQRGRRARRGRGAGTHDPKRPPPPPAAREVLGTRPAGGGHEECFTVYD